MNGVDVKQFFFRILVCLCAIGLVGLIAGCDPNLHRQAEAMPIERNISVHELSKRLNLPVIESNHSLARLGNSGSVVTIFTEPSGSVYVNGREIVTAADIIPGEETIILPAGLEDEIRHALYIDSAERKTRSKLSKAPKFLPDPNIGIVVIDPGHGGKDPGAMNGSKYQEKRINLAVSHAVAQQLRKSNVDVRMTRDSDVFIELDDRAGICNRAKPDLFVSIHADAAQNRRAKGFTVYVPKREKKGSRSHRAGQNVSRKMGGIAISRGVQQHKKRLRVLENTRYPAMLIELGFISNPYEASMLNRKNYQEKLAQAIADGILLYLKRK